MEIEMRACCQIPGKKEIRNVFRRLGCMLRNTVTFIASCREAQTRRRIQLYFDDRLIDELAKVGTKIVKKDVND